MFNFHHAHKVYCVVTMTDHFALLYFIWYQPAEGSKYMYRTYFREIRKEKNERKE